MMTTKGTLPVEALSVITGKIGWELILVFLCKLCACVSSCVITVAVARSHLPSAGFSLPMTHIVG